MRNIGHLVQAESEPVRLRRGKEMRELPLLRDAWLLMEDGIISDFGLMADDYPETDEVFDVDGKMVFPSWCDPHTHLLFAGSREAEFVDRIQGLSYEEIARRGGGILNSAKRLREAGDDDILRPTIRRLREIIRLGTGAVEIKSGYGLSTESELKMLRLIKSLKATMPIEIRSTFLGAHAVPEGYLGDRSVYVRMIIEEMLPAIHEGELADFVDVFCDDGFFTADETDLILKAAGRYGLRGKIHANELGFSGGIQVGVLRRALSVDHLQHTGDAEIGALLGSETMPTLLPSTAFFLRLGYPPARKMIDSGLPVALATDYNPGSSPSGKMAFVISLACIHMGMLPDEAINAATINAAYAMGLEKTHGSIARGKVANVFITRKIPSIAYLPYAFGSQVVEHVILKGEFIAAR